MVDLLKKTFLGFFREDEGSTPVLQPHTQACVTDPLITDLEVMRALGGLNPHKGAGRDGLFPKVLKAINYHISPVFARMFNLSLRTAQVPEDWCLAIVTPRTTNPRQFLPRRSTVTNLRPDEEGFTLFGLTKGTQPKLSTWIFPKHLTQ